MINHRILGCLSTFTLFLWVTPVNHNRLWVSLDCFACHCLASAIFSRPCFRPQFLIILIFTIHMDIRWYKTKRWCYGTPSSSPASLQFHSFTMNFKWFDQWFQDIPSHWSQLTSHDCSVAWPTGARESVQGSFQQHHEALALRMDVDLNQQNGQGDRMMNYDELVDLAYTGIPWPMYTLSLEKPGWTQPSALEGPPTIMVRRAATDRCQMFWTLSIENCKYFSTTLACQDT